MIGNARRILTDELPATSLSRRLGVAYPIFGFAHSIDAVAAVSNAGGIGIYGATRDTPEEIRERLERLRKLVGDRPFGVDLVLPNGCRRATTAKRSSASCSRPHRRFVAGLYQQYGVPPATKAGMRSRFVRSVEMAEQQIEAVLGSDVNLFACGIECAAGGRRRSEGARQADRCTDRFAAACTRARSTA